MARIQNDHVPNYFQILKHHLKTIFLQIILSILYFEFNLKTKFNIRFLVN